MHSSSVHCSLPQKPLKSNILPQTHVYHILLPTYFNSIYLLLRCLSVYVLCLPFVFCSLFGWAFVALRLRSGRLFLRFSHTFCHILSYSYFRPVPRNTLLPAHHRHLYDLYTLSIALRYPSLVSFLCYSPTVRWDAPGLDHHPTPSPRHVRLYARPPIYHGFFGLWLR